MRRPSSTSTHDAGVVVEQGVVLVERAGVLGERVEEPPERREGLAVHAVAVGGGVARRAGPGGSAEWMAKAARFTGQSPSTTSPSWFTRRRSLTRISPKCMPNGLTQKWSVRSGSRTVMWPAGPSSYPSRAHTRNAAARCCLR